MSPDNEEDTVRTSELIKPTALFTIQMEQSDLSDKISAVFMIAFLTGEIIGPMLGGGLEKLEGFNFTSLSMVYLCIMIFGAYLIAVIVEWYKKPKYTTINPV